MDFSSSIDPSCPPVSSPRGDQFPPEIFAEFAEYLTAKCLLNLSLASRSLRKEAQRVLFRAMDHTRFQNRPGLTAKRDTHCLFLSAIINAPTRLGPHVHTYTSRFLTDVAAYSEEYDEHCLPLLKNRYSAESRDLWDLTSRALPLLTQLKQLTLFLGTDETYLRKGLEPSPFRGTSILRRCNFVLDSFSWGETHGLQNGISDLEEFLSRQPNLQLLHLNTYHKNPWYTDDVPQFQLDPQTLPCLERMIGPPSLLSALLSKSRPINTVFWSEPWSPAMSILTEDAQKGLQRVKCLSLLDIDTLAILCSSLSSAETLYIKQVPASFHKDMSVLTHLKSLRVLILDVDSWDFESLQNTPPTSPILHMAATAFEICAGTLQGVHFPFIWFKECNILSVDKTGQFQIQQPHTVLNTAQPSRPWIRQDQPTWPRIEDYL